MQKKITKSKHIFIKITLVLILANALVVSKSYVNQITTGREFFLSFAMIVLLIATIFLKLKDNTKNQISFSLTDVILIGYITYIIVNAFVKNSYVLSTNFFINHIIVFIFYFVVKWLIKNNIISFQFIFNSLLIILGAEILWAYLQYFGALKSYHADFPITGSFENPGPLTTYLVMLFPLCIGLFFSEKDKRMLKIIYLAIAILVVVLLVLLNQRAPWIGAILGVFTVLLLRYKHVIRNWMRKPLVIYPMGAFFMAAIVFSSIFLYQHKLESSQGRVFIWKNCMDLIGDKPLFGHGFENYLMVMNDKQAEYFAEHPTDMDNAMRVTNIEFAFNDHLQFIVETGIVGYFLLLGFIFLSIRNALLRDDASLYYGPFAAVIVMLILALVTYPFHTLSIEVVFFLYLAVFNSKIFNNKEYVYSTKTLKLLLISLIIVSFSGGLFQIRRLKAQKHWKKIAFTIQKSKNPLKEFREYKELLPILKYDRYFLYNYAAELSVRGLHKESIPVFEEALGKINDSDTYLYLANSYENLGQMDKAEECYVQAMNLIPHRFYPRYRLVMLWFNQGKNVEALKMSKCTLDMPVKVKSDVVDNILNEIRNLYISFLPLPNDILTEQLNYSLHISGENLNELVNVLDYYRKDPADSLKLNAAAFLIENMPGHYGVYHRNLDDPDAIFENIERTLRSGELPAFLKEDEVKKIPNNAYIAYDVNVIKSDFLISHIDNAFDAWQTYPWCKNVSYEDFKTYLLPYRIADEPLMDMREHFRKDYAWLVDTIQGSDDMKLAFKLVYKDFTKAPKIRRGWQFGNIQNKYDAIRLCKGECEHLTLIKSTIMRALGIFCVYDEIPHWANRNKNHSWNAFPDTGEIPLIIDGDDSLRHHKYLHSAEYPVEVPADSFLPFYLKVMPAKKGTKVLRKTYVASSENRIINNPNTEYVPNYFTDIFIKDISESYLNCFDVEVKVNENTNKSYAYLCVFELGNLIPVHIGKIDKGSVVFKKMGSDVLYFPAVIHEGNYYAIGDPFILTNNGEKKILTPKINISQNIEIYRKYPLFVNILNYGNRMYGGMFQGSNVKDFSGAQNLFTIKETYLTPTEISVTDNNKYRYFRYLPDSTKNGDIAELMFYYDSLGLTRPMKGNVIYRFEGPSENNFNKSSDNNLETYYDCRQLGTWIGIDMGEGNAKRVTKIKFCPRTDTNFIIPGNDYELFYWDNGWKSLGRKIATDYHMVFGNVPNDALFWLHCHSGGQEERPFTYENGVQVWW